MTTPGLRLRPFAGDADVPPIVAIQVAVARHEAAPYAPTENDFRNEALRGEGFDPARDVLVAELDGRIVGAAIVSAAIRDDEWRIHHAGVVDPAFRRRGIGGALFRAMAARGRELAAARPDGRRRWLTTHAEEPDLGGRALALAAGYDPFRWFAMMGRDLTTALPPPLPVEGIELRPLRLEDRRTVMTALEEAFHDHPGYRAWDELDFRNFFESPEADLSLWRVAWAGDEVAGVSHNVLAHGEARSLGHLQGWIHGIGVRRPWRGRGVGKLLVASSLAAFQAGGAARAMLGVDLHNPSGALGLYEGLGFATVARTTLYQRALPPAGERSSTSS